MNITPVIFFEMAAAILILATALVALVFYLSRILKILHANLGLEDEASQKNTKLLEEARIKAIKIIDDANSQALDIISKVTLSTDISMENFKENLARSSSAQIKEFEKITSDFTNLYFEILQRLQSKNIEIFQNVSKDIEEQAMAEIKNFKESMLELTVSSQKEVRRKIDTDYETARREVEEYKKEELQKINSKVYEFLEKMSKLVLGKVLNFSEHEDLIEKSIEKAEKEGAFEER